MDVPIGYCLDTCHLLAAGFDIATAAGLHDQCFWQDAAGRFELHFFATQSDSVKPDA